MRSTIFAALLGVVGIVASQQSDATSIRCLNCTDAQMYSAAVGQGPKPSPFLVWNPVNGAVKKFRTYCGTLNSVDPGTSRRGGVTEGACTNQAEELSVDADTVSVAAALSQVFNATGGTLKGMVTANISGVQFPTYLPHQPTAHNFLMDGNLRSRILDMAGTSQIFTMNPHSVLSGPLALIAGHADAMLGFTEGLVITIEVVFSDGSSVQVRATIGENATYVSQSARDNTGQWLPDKTGNMQDYTGQWYYNPQQGYDMTAFLEYMRQLGITVTYGTTGSGTGVIKCRWDPANNETICMLPR